MFFRTDRCLVTTYCCWQSPGENLWQNELKQTGQDLIWHERKPISRGERTPDMMPERRYCRQRWGQKYSSSLIMTLSTHNPGNINRSPWRPVPPKSAFVTPQKHKHFIDSEPLPVITTLWSCRAWICCIGCTSTVRQEEQVPGQHLTKWSHIVGKSLSMKGFLLDVPKKAC